MDPIYGRRVERTALLALLDRARTSTGSAVLVLRGDAGIGKPALLTDTVERADGMHVIAATGVESEVELAFAGLHQIVWQPRHSPLEQHPERLGYLLKDRVADGAVLVDALRRLADGETVIDPTIVSRLLQRHRETDPLDEFSEREREVLSLVAEGCSNAAIAKRLFVTERTVEWHVKQIFRKLRIDETPDANRRVLAVLAFLRSST
jgi:DNA-binding CsgD family transcriptional regulator